MCSGLVQNKVAHYHSDEYFEKVYQLSIRPLCLLDIVNYVAKTQPVLIVECIREPVSRAISTLFHMFGSGKKEYSPSCNYDFIENWICGHLDKNEHPYARNWIKYYNTCILSEYDLSKGFLYKKVDKNISLLFLRYEDLKSRKNIFESTGYAFEEKHVNSIQSNSLLISNSNAKKHVKFPISRLKIWYSDKYIKYLYSQTGIENFINTYTKK